MGVELLEHNQRAYDEVKKLYEQGNRAAVIHPTGTGKSFIALKLIEENKDKKVVYLSSGVPILNQLKRNMIVSDVHCEKLKRMTYQKLTLMDEAERTDLEADIIVLDEFHHCGAPEWGKAVEELLSNNPNAKVLGLSATPMRYYDDQIRDMAEELFDDCVASEMSLEEAITSGILPEPEYTAGFYEYSEIISQLEEKINKCTDPEKKRLAEEEIEKLRNMLESSVSGLPELLENSMTNKLGRYIVYCKDIEDMQKKMSEAQKMFEKVNPNMEIMSVSSSEEDIRKNASTIRKFEKDSDDGKLKLLFSVNMLNEGYHLPKLDGVIMMRPTHSPTLYYQQLGRAMTVGEGKKPVIIDLVNNIDSIEIIQNFSKSLEQERRKRNKNESKSRIGFSISKETRNVEEVVRKIEDFVKRERTDISNEEKLRLMLEYMEKTGEKISFDTQYEGYRIGHIKSNLRQMYRSGTLNISEELLQKFIENGIIIEGKERRDQTTQQEKYEFLMQMVGKTPEEIASARMRNGMSVKEALKALRIEINRGKSSLTQEQIKELKTEKFLELSSEEKSELAKKYGLPEKYAVIADEIWNSREEFIKAFKTAGDISENSQNFQILKEISEIKQSKFFHGPRILTISSKDMTEMQKLMYAKLLSDVFKIDINKFDNSYYFDIDGVDEAISTLNEQEQKTVKMRNGLDGGKIYTFEETGKELNMSKTRCAQIYAKAMRRLQHCSRASKIIKDVSDIRKLKEGYEGIKQNRDDISKIIEILGKLKKYIIENGETDSIDEIESKIREISDNDIDLPKSLENNTDSNLTIEELDLSVRSYNCLYKAGIRTLGDLMSKSETEIRVMRNLGKKSYEEILEKIKKYKNPIINILLMSDNNEQEKNELNDYKKDDEVEKQKNVGIEELDLSVRAYNCLYRAGIKTLGDLMSISKEEFKEIRNLGQKSHDEVLEKLKMHGIGLGDDKQSKKSKRFNVEFLDERIEFCKKAKNEMQHELEEKMKVVEEKMEIYNSAMDFYLNEEDIFNPDAIIPGIERLRKIRRAKDLVNLNKEQDNEIAELESQMKGIDIDD